MRKLTTLAAGIAVTLSACTSAIATPPEVAVGPATASAPAPPSWEQRVPEEDRPTRGPTPDAGCTTTGTYC